jgi:hypothetical protein
MTAHRGRCPIIARQDVPPGTVDLASFAGKPRLAHTIRAADHANFHTAMRTRPIGATDMVEGVRAGGGIGRSVPVARDTSATVEGQFIVNDGAASVAQNARASSTAGIGLETMLALQAVDEAEERDRAAHKRGTAMLTALSGLQRTMLMAEDPSMALLALNELSKDGPLADDPGLGAILRAVILRCRVELARRGMTADAVERHFITTG